MVDEKPKVRTRTKYGYGTGHIINDMASSLWFTYLLVFYQNVIQLHPTNAGLILLVGQIADGIATLLVGFFSDRDANSSLCIRYGKRKVYYSITLILCPP